MGAAGRPGAGGARPLLRRHARVPHHRRRAVAGISRRARPGRSGGAPRQADPRLGGAARRTRGGGRLDRLDSRHRGAAGGDRAPQPRCGGAARPRPGPRRRRLGRHRRGRERAGERLRAPAVRPQATHRPARHPAPGCRTAGAAGGRSRGAAPADRRGPAARRDHRPLGRDRCCRWRPRSGHGRRHADGGTQRAGGGDGDRAGAARGGGDAGGDGGAGDPRSHDRPQGGGRARPLGPGHRRFRRHAARPPGRGHLRPAGRRGGAVGCRSGAPPGARQASAGRLRHEPARLPARGAHAGDRAVPRQPGGRRRHQARRGAGQGACRTG